MSTPAEVVADVREQIMAVMSHVDRLNSWVRSPSARRGWSGYAVHRVIYHYKNEAIRAALVAGLAACRRIAIVMICRDCRGTKRYTDQYGYTHPHCRACNSTGRVRLQFIETTIAGYKWHSPVGSWRQASTHFGDWAKWPEESADCGWQPNLPGIDLTPTEVAVSLNAVEACFPKPPPKRWVAFDRDDGAVQDDFAVYTLHVGTTHAGWCAACREPIAQGRPRRIGTSSGRIEWTAHVCEGCGATLGTTLFDAVKARGCAELLTPELLEWMARHPVPERMR